MRSTNKETTMKTVMIGAFVLFYASLYAVDACRCLPLSMLPPVKDCPDMFLAIFNITAVQRTPQLTRHEFRVISDYTPKLKNHQNLADSRFINSHGNEASCGISLSPDNVYLLMGRLATKESEPVISMCGCIFEQLPHTPTADEAKDLLDKTFEKRCVEKKETTN